MTALLPEARLFLELARRSFARELTYRAAALAGLLTNLFFGMLRVAVLLALLDARPQPGYSALDAITYTGLTQLLLGVLSVFGWFELMRGVHSGEIAGDLLRPLDLFSFWLARDAGRALAQLLMRGLPILALYALLFGFRWPASGAQWLAVVVSVLLAWLVGFAFRFLVNLAAFWSPDAIGIGRFAFTVLMFACGFLMPLRLFPEWVQTACAWTPFPSMLNTVVEIWLGQRAGAAAWQAIGAQAAWALGLIALSQFVLARGTRRLVVLGG